MAEFAALSRLSRGGLSWRDLLAMPDEWVIEMLEAFARQRQMEEKAAKELGD